VPVVYRAAGPDLVMDRVPGSTLQAALVDGEVDASFAGQTLADLHNRLARVPARLSPDPDVRVLHLDLHPDNVLLGPRGPVLIDWRNTCEGPHDLDVAMSALILAQVAVSEQSNLTLATLTAFAHAVDGQPLSQLDTAVARRGADPNLTSREVQDLPRATTLARDCF
jgi:Ser/Thr protein kinase RdoA (MazF antagonist)